MWAHHLCSSVTLLSEARSAAVLDTDNDAPDHEAGAHPPLVGPRRHSVYDRSAPSSETRTLIGTAWIASDVIDRFARFPELGIEKADKRAVALAGLCHDLGHGPFSHVFEHEFVPAISARKGVSADRVWRHEEMSEKIIENVLTANIIWNATSAIPGMSPSSSVTSYRNR